MEPVPSPLGMGAPTMLPPPVSTQLPRKVLAGFILEGVGVVFTGISYGWNYFGFRAGYVASFQDVIRIEILLSVVQYLCIEVGLFLIISGILRLLPEVRPWSRVGPIAILVGALLIAVLELYEVGSIFPNGATPLPDWVSYALEATLIAGYVLATTGLVVSLFAVAKGILSRGRPAAGLPQP